MIRIEQLTKTYPGAAAPVLRNLSLDIETGQLVSVMGGSGCGKSTLLRCLVGLESFEQGTLDIEGIRMSGSSQMSAARRLEAIHKMRSHVGFVFQSFELFPHLTALENCVLAQIRVQGRSRADAESRAGHHLEQLGLDGKFHSHPDQLSGGQRQRVAIARALCLEPRVLLYDEPTSALDPTLRAEVVETLQKIRNQGVTQMVVTHDRSVARAGDILVVLAAGNILESGPPSDLMTSPRNEATRRFLCTPETGQSPKTIKTNV